MNLFEGVLRAELAIEFSDPEAAGRFCAEAGDAAAIAEDDPRRVQLVLYSEETPNLAAVGAIGRLAAAGALEMISGLEGLAADLVPPPKSA